MTPRKTRRPMRATTALAATLSLALPQGVLVPEALAQETVSLCLDLAAPPCPEGEPAEGTAFTLTEDGEIAPAAEVEEAPAVAVEGAVEPEAPVEEAVEPEAPVEEAVEPEAPVEEAIEEPSGEVVAEEPVEETALEEMPVEEMPVEETEADLAADAQAEAEAVAQEEAAAAEAAEAEAAAAAVAEEAAAAEAAVLAEDAARAEAEAADAQAQAEVDAAATAEAAAAAESEAQAAAEAEAALTAQAEAEAAAQVEVEAAARAEAEAQAAAEEAVAAEAEAADAAAAEAAAQAEAEQAVAVEEALVPDETAATEVEEGPAAAEDEAAAAVEDLAVDEVIVDELAAEEALEAELLDPTIEAEAEPVAAAVEAELAADAETSSGAEVVVEEVGEGDVRKAEEDFATSVEGEALAESEGGEAVAEDDDDSGLSDLEKVLLLGLGAVAVGSVLRNGDEVVSNSGDRVVVEDESGGYVVYRDDDALLRQAGSTVRTETFSDGSTRTVLDREDGTQVVTIRDAEGRVLRRARVYPDGSSVELFDDLGGSEAVDVATLLEESAPAPMFSSGGIEREELRAALGRELEYDPGRTFSLRQVREIAAVRNLVPGIDLDSITFPSGSAAIPGDQLTALVEMGLLIEEFLEENPGEVFLIEGHTDAVGGEAYNLALSDRRAETVALALTENFAVPPENLVVQGYGERYLKVATGVDEPLNRRATVRRITPLLNVVASSE